MQTKEAVQPAAQGSKRQQRSPFKATRLLGAGGKVAGKKRSRDGSLARERQVQRQPAYCQACFRTRKAGKLVTWCKCRLACLTLCPMPLPDHACQQACEREAEPEPQQQEQAEDEEREEPLPDQDYPEASVVCRLPHDPWPALDCGTKQRWKVL
jgi:hypothetical protein